MGERFDVAQQLQYKESVANPETQAILEKALHHVLAEQAKLLSHEKSGLMIEPALELGDLAAKTWNLLCQGLHKIRSDVRLTEQARAIERKVDAISETHWFFLPIEVSAIYERVEESFSLRPIEERLQLKTAIEVRKHFHNLRLLLLEQLLAARMLINNSDYGTEGERVWQQFLQRELGPDFRVLQGGHIFGSSKKLVRRGWADGIEDGA